MKHGGGFTKTYQFVMLNTQAMACLGMPLPGLVLASDCTREKEAASSTPAQ